MSLMVMRGIVEQEQDEEAEGSEVQDQGRPERSRCVHMDAATNGHVRWLSEFLESTGETRAPHNIPPDDLQ